MATAQQRPFYLKAKYARHAPLNTFLDINNQCDEPRRDLWQSIVEDEVQGGQHKTSTDSFSITTTEWNQKHWWRYRDWRFQSSFSRLNIYRRRFRKIPPIGNSKRLNQQDRRMFYFLPYKKVENEKPKTSRNNTKVWYQSRAWNVVVVKEVNASVANIRYQEKEGGRRPIPSKDNNNGKALQQPADYNSLYVTTNMTTEALTNDSHDNGSSYNDYNYNGSSYNDYNHNGSS